MLVYIRGKSEEGFVVCLELYVSSRVWSEVSFSSNRRWVWTECFSTPDSNLHILSCSLRAPNSLSTLRQIISLAVWLQRLASFHVWSCSILDFALAVLADNSFNIRVTETLWTITSWHTCKKKKSRQYSNTAQGKLFIRCRKLSYNPEKQPEPQWTLQWSLIP